MNPLWPHQTYAIEETQAAIARGERRICLTSPTGGGKTRVACELIDRWLTEGHRVVLYTNRKLLIEQTSAVLRRHGIDHGVRASGHDLDLAADVQVSSIQTENARVLRRGTWRLHPAERVLVDEAHLQKGDVARKLLDAHHQEGAAYVGLTATPLDIGHLYDCLIQAGTTSELRACGALVPCRHYGPDEPDLRAIGRVQLGMDLPEELVRKAIMTPTIWARVYEWWKTLNPDARATILFAPGVGESVWFAEQFEAKGVKAAHIDGQEVWVNGKTYRSDREARRDVLAASRDGRIAVLCNRFVLREGIDAPWLAHGIFATVYGSLQSYLQSGGRLLRAHPGVEAVSLQDHGGNWWRHGSLNADRHWSLSHTPTMIAGVRANRIRDGKEREPARCPQCGLILGGSRCSGCGFVIQPGKKSRPVIQVDGSLLELGGDVFRPRRITRRPDADKLWERMYHRAKRADMTFAQAEALFALENNWGYPPRDVPLMPKNDLDWFRKVSEVPRENLT